MWLTIGFSWSSSGSLSLVSEEVDAMRRGYASRDWSRDRSGVAGGHRRPALAVPLAPARGAGAPQREAPRLARRLARWRGVELPRPATVGRAGAGVRADGRDAARGVPRCRRPPPGVDGVPRRSR